MLFENLLIIPFIAPLLCSSETKKQNEGIPLYKKFKKCNKNNRLTIVLSGKFLDRTYSMTQMATMIVGDPRY